MTTELQTSFEPSSHSLLVYFPNAQLNVNFQYNAFSKRHNVP
jgi:hypothetical protein